MGAQQNTFIIHIYDRHKHDSRMKHDNTTIEWPTKSARCDHREVSTDIVSSDNRHSLTATV